MMQSARLQLGDLSAEERWGLGLLVAIVVLGSLVPVFSPYDPRLGGTGVPLNAPSVAHLFGTDDLGRDVFTRTFAAAQSDLALALIGVVIPLSVGTLIGAIIGTTRLPLVSGVWMIVVESINAFPFIVIVLALVSVVGGGAVGVVVALSLTNWARYAKLARARAQVIRNADFIHATQVLGYSRARVLLRHILPNVYAESIAYALSDFVLVILVIAGLSYLGAGLKPPAPEWGAMMSDGRLFITTAWWIPVFPGLALSLTAVAVALLADGIDGRRGRD
jgi:peptide/nickel transport system permease protein